ncbi:MAG TPA: helix-turn-helix transcriptional regulator [Trueperaceae bacterium]
MPPTTAFAPYFAVIRLRIRRARETAGLTQEAAAERAGVAVRVWQRYEGRKTDISDPGLWTLLRIAQGLDVDFEGLIEMPSNLELEAARELEYYPTQDRN